MNYQSASDPNKVNPLPEAAYGYSQPPAYGQPQPAPAGGGTVVVNTVTTNQQSSGMREAIPALPMPLAILLCVINFFLPGVGTVIAGFSVLCCGNVGQSGGGRFGTFCINFWVGWLQLLLAPFIWGWVWSIMWGYAFIASSGSDGGTTTTTSTVVVAK